MTIPISPIAGVPPKNNTPATTNDRLHRSRQLSSRVGQYLLDVEAAAQNALHYVRDELDRHEDVHLNTGDFLGILDHTREVFDRIEKTAIHH
ncbi:hypothetical protein [Nesterenkonia muleiensis]|uniref:hypothetical protein n=1 Tax=Nesterenkonia muleiensis TaxID=2282648 RepID=UPI000E7335C5|nr:hypothetical protein [Nesterenkonia muleiensis]